MIDEGNSTATANAHKFPLLMGWEAKKIREALPKQSFLIEFGKLEHVTATGRAKCRCCGQKITKGEACIRFYWDFAGCGSWTTVQVHMHIAECQPPRPLA